MSGIMVIVIVIGIAALLTILGDSKKKNSQSKENPSYRIKISTDPFTKQTRIDFELIAGFGLDKMMTWADNDSVMLQIGLRYNDQNKYITFATFQKDLTFKISDKVLLLLEDDTVLEFEVDEKGYRFDKDDEGVIIETKKVIDFETVNELSIKKLKNWRYIQDGRSPLTSSLSNKEQVAIQKMASIFLEKLNELGLK